MKDSEWFSRQKSSSTSFELTLAGFTRHCSVSDTVGPVVSLQGFPDVPDGFASKLWQLRVSGTACLPILRDSWRCTTTFKLRKKWHCICSYVLNTWGNKLLLLILLLYLRPPLLLFLVLISGAKTPERVHTGVQNVHRSGTQSVHRCIQACTGAQAPQKNLSWQDMGDFAFVQLFWCGTCWLNALCRSWA